MIRSGIAAGPTSPHSWRGIVYTTIHLSPSPLFLSLEMRATTASGGSSRTSFNLQAAQGDGGGNAGGCGGARWFSCLLALVLALKLTLYLATVFVNGPPPTQLAMAIAS